MAVTCVFTVLLSSLDHLVSEKSKYKVVIIYLFIFRKTFHSLHIHTVSKCAMIISRLFAHQNLRTFLGLLVWKKKHIIYLPAKHSVKMSCGQKNKSSHFVRGIWFKVPGPGSRMFCSHNKGILFFFMKDENSRKIVWPWRSVLKWMPVFFSFIFFVKWIRMIIFCR